ncbi:MAG: hypothetical protein HY958_14075 [Bacteroidia bacterium]|nr:hypothetical protein [Bacteroidia bacterium]
MIFKIENILRFSLIALGVSLLVTQVILIREFLSVFYGNELVMGILFANWMLITGAGAFLGKFFGRIKNKLRLILIAQLLVSILPLVIVFALRALKNIVFPVGSMLNIYHVFISSFVLLLPFCILSGFLFTQYCSVYFEKFQKNKIGLVYALDAIGSFAGGLLFNFILIYFFKTFQSLAIIMAVNLIAVNMLLFLKFPVNGESGHNEQNHNLPLKIFVAIFSAGLLILPFIRDWDTYSGALLYKGQQITYQKDTPYGNLVITKTAEQNNFFENGVLLFSTGNVIENEEAVHYGMIQHPAPKNVLLVSGGISGTIKEILKYNVDRVDYLETNPWLTEIGRNYTADMSDKRVSVINKDAVLFLKETSVKYDVALLNIPEPSNAELNRFYTVEFFERLKLKLNRNAVVSIALPATENYISEEAGQMNSILYNTLGSVFRKVIIFPGNKNYFLASDSGLTLQINEKIVKREINNSYVNMYYLDESTISRKSGLLHSNISLTTPVNKDFVPVSYYRQIVYWLSFFKYNYTVITAVIFLLAAALVFLLSRMSAINFGLFTTGFAASSLELILIVSFQVIYGSVYQMTGIIIMLFMAGLAIGALVTHKLIRSSYRNFIILQFSIAAYALLMPCILIILNHFSNHPVLIHILFMTVTLDIAILTGAQFSFATMLQEKNISSVAAVSYGADLLGSAIGAILVSAFLIPVLGIFKVCIVIGILNLISGIILYFKSPG